MDVIPKRQYILLLFIVQYIYYYYVYCWNVQYLYLGIRMYVCSCILIFEVLKIFWY